MTVNTILARDIGTEVNEAPAPALALLPSDLVKLQAWFSPSFPVGAFSYSHGLEWAVENADVRSARLLGEWVEGVVRYGAGRSDAIVLCALYRSLSSRDWSKTSEVACLAVALQPTAERRMESLGQGGAFFSAVTAGWPHPLMQRFRKACPGEIAYPVAVAAAAAAHDLPLDAVLVAYLHAFSANQVSAGVRLIPLGQTDGIGVVVSLEPAILDVAHEAHETGLEELGSSGFLADIASMRHETQYSRLFRS